MSNTGSPLGIFDSGVGGLTVLKKIMESLPSEDTIYLGDTARVPYGDKSPATVERFSLQNASFLASHGVKLLIVACNTASAHAVEAIRENHPLSVIDVIEPAVRCAAEATRNGKIAVLGTRATIASQVYIRKIRQLIPSAEVLSIACPLFVPLVEEEFLDHPAASLIVQEYLKPVVHSGIDTVILGCTHYPLLLPLFRKELGDGVSIIDSATACTKRVVEELEIKKLKRNLLQKGQRKYYASDDIEKFRRLGKNFLGLSIECVESYVFDG